MTIDRFTGNSDRFQDAADLIARHCINFAGHRAGGCRVFNILARQFSKCDPAAVEYGFDALCQVPGAQIHCTAYVSIDGNVRFVPVK